MSNSCTDGQCSTGKAGCGPQGCSQGSCSSSSCCTSGDCSPQGYLTKMVCGVDCAKKSLMKEKMQAHLEKRMGKKMDSLAELAVDLYLQKMQGKIDCMSSLQEAEQKMQQIIAEE